MLIAAWFNYINRIVDALGINGDRSLDAGRRSARDEIGNVTPSTKRRSSTPEKSMSTEHSIAFPGRRAAWLVLTAIVLAGVTMVFAPVWIIQPFKAQTEAGVEWSYALRRWSPLITLIASAAASALVVWLWSASSRWWRKAALVAIVLPLLAATWFARQNHFEWMFNPLDRAAYARADAAEFVADSDMVLAVEGGEERVAYPVRLMAYHHIVQDVVGGTPVVATY